MQHIFSYVSWFLERVCGRIVSWALGILWLWFRDTTRLGSTMDAKHTHTHSAGALSLAETPLPFLPVFEHQSPSGDILGPTHGCVRGWTIQDSFPYGLVSPGPAGSGLRAPGWLGLSRRAAGLLARQCRGPPNTKVKSSQPS